MFFLQADFLKHLTYSAHRDIGRATFKGSRQVIFNSIGGLYSGQILHISRLKMRQYIDAGGMILLKMLKGWGPAYLWYSGILFQCLIVLFGLQALLGRMIVRPTHVAERDLNAFLSDDKNCTDLFAGQEFSWLSPARVDLKPDFFNRSAELDRLIYRNAGSYALDENGNHVYRVYFEADIKDKKTGEIVRFPPHVEQYFEVARNGKINRCNSTYKSQVTPAANLQESVTRPCDEKGWSRRLLCDRGTERCYPLAQCERRGT